MKADDFVHALLGLRPTIESLIGKGLTETEAEHARNRNVCVPRPGIQPVGDPLLDLITRYDCSSVEIGMIQLIAAPIDEGETWQVGEDEADPIVINKESGDIAVYSLSHPDYVISECAGSSGRFLDALALCASFLRHLAEHDPRRTDQEACHRFARECAIAAGGDTYLPYYEYLLGCE